MNYEVNQQTNPIGRNEYLRTTLPVELSNENLLDAQTITAGDIEKDVEDEALRGRYNDLAAEYGVRIDRGDQLESDERIAEKKAKAEWFFNNDAVSIDDEDFQAYIGNDDGPAISPADGVALILYRPMALATCEELEIFAGVIKRRLSNMDDDNRAYDPRGAELLVTRLETLQLEDIKRHGENCVDCGVKLTPENVALGEEPFDTTKPMTDDELAELRTMTADIAELYISDLSSECRAKLTVQEAYVAGWHDFMHGDSDEPEHPSLIEDMESIRKEESDPTGPDGQTLTIVGAYAEGYCTAVMCCRYANVAAAEKAAAANEAE